MRNQRRRRCRNENCSKWCHLGRVRTLRAESSVGFSVGGTGAATKAKTTREKSCGIFMTREANGSFQE
jgi:hypothetical protein